MRKRIREEVGGDEWKREERGREEHREKSGGRKVGSRMEEKQKG